MALGCARAPWTVRVYHALSCSRHYCKHLQGPAALQAVPAAKYMATHYICSRHGGSNELREGRLQRLEVQEATCWNTRFPHNTAVARRRV